MSIQAFLTPNTEITKKVIISDRFKDADGKAVPFVIRSLSQEENEQLRKLSSVPVVKNGVKVDEKMDALKYGRELILACVKEPNFRDKELCDYYKTMDPLEVPGKMLKAGEYNKLVSAINDINGFKNNEYEELAEEAKN